MADENVIWEGDVEGQHVAVALSNTMLDVHVSGRATAIVVDKAKTMALRTMLTTCDSLRAEHTALQATHTKDVDVIATLLACVADLGTQLQTTREELTKQMVLAGVDSDGIEDVLVRIRETAEELRQCAPYFMNAMGQPRVVTAAEVIRVLRERIAKLKTSAHVVAEQPTENNRNG
jgi:hypothetical protein